jgi:uncharacterized metal-binding protein YceD (DUF177 family)
VKKKVEHIVRFPGPKERTDTFEFLLDDSFFAFHEEADWQGGDILAEIEMIKKPDMVTLHFRLKGSVKVICDRCLEDYEQEVDTNETLYLKYGNEPGEMEENIVIISPEQHQVDVTHYLFEFILLSLPVRKVHPDKSSGAPGCDPNMIEKLERLTISEDNKEIDPRWEELKKLIEKN